MIQLSIEQRLFGRCTLSKSGCWEFGGSLASTGYGQVVFAGKQRTTHGVAYEFVYGAIPKGMHLHHNCQNRACCNPDHLEVLSPYEHRQRHRQTHCYRGHELRKGARQCIECVRLWHYNRTGVVRRPKDQGITHCSRGHELTPENVYVRPDGKGRKICKACCCLRTAMYRQRKKIAS